MERGALMPEYRVEWSIEAEADDRQAAARLALAIQQSGNRSHERRLQCLGQHDPDHPTIVDLYPESSRPIAGDLTCPKSR